MIEIKRPGLMSAQPRVAQLIFLMLLVSITLFGCGGTHDNIVLVDSDDAAMEAAISRARATLDQFLALYGNPPGGAERFKLKVRFSSPRGTEHMWVTPFHQTETGFAGTLADDPEYATDLKNGQEVSFLRDAISDWGYVLNGKQKGSFTVCVLFKKMPAAEVEKYRADYGFEC